MIYIENITFKTAKSEIHLGNAGLGIFVKMKEIFKTRFFNFYMCVIFIFLFFLLQISFPAS